METSIKVLSFTPKRVDNIAKYRKEKHFNREYSLIIVTEQGFFVPLIIRTYVTLSKSYACGWVIDNVKELYAHAGDSAGGYGYHRESAAIDGVLELMGIELSESINGRGDSAIIEAIEAFAKFNGYERFYVHKAHA